MAQLDDVHSVLRLNYETLRGLISLASLSVAKPTLYENGRHCPVQFVLGSGKLRGREAVCPRVIKSKQRFFVEGFWTVQFTGVQGWGAGVITLIGGRVFEGDSGFLYTGTYTQQGNTLTARVHIKQYVAGIANVMGRNEFDLELTGTLQGNIISATGTTPGTPLRLNGTMTKQADLPAR